MIESTSVDYSEFVKIDLESKLQPINQSVDELLMRLEEFETMVFLIQQERCNAIGLTGSLTDCIDIQPQLQIMCQRIDALEKLMEHLKSHINAIELKLESMEEKFGLNDNGNLFKNFLKTSLFKKAPDVKKVSVDITAPIEELSIKEYFENHETK